ncbi:MAG: DUF2628 domain-containing protein [Alphaproteobacteria bacterium]
MKVFTVHRRETGSPPGGITARDGDPVLVKEGFAWLGALFGPFWALAHGMWSWALVTALASVAFATLVQRVPMHPGVQAVLAAGLFVLIGAHANDARRRSLAARGYREVAVVTARDIDGALMRYMDGAFMARKDAP